MNLPEQITCKQERFEKEVPVEEFYRDCVDVDYFLSLCRKCPNYDKIWSCPAYNFDVREYWNRYQRMRIIGVKVLVPEELLDQTWTSGEMMHLYKNILGPVKEKLTEELYRLEEEVADSVHLSAGSCRLCPEGTCSKQSGQPCRNPKKMRYSIESLGGNVTKAAEYLGQTIEWSDGKTLPRHFLLVSALLY